MKLKLALLIGLFAFGYAMSASAGAVVDTDTDLVPDQFDNCKGTGPTDTANKNGPNQLSNQVDTDIDGWGNVCDADYTNITGTLPPFLVSGADFTIFLANFGSSTAAARESDHNGDNLISGADFTRFLQLFGVSMVGTSGLACAGTIPCTP